MLGTFGHGGFLFLGGLLGVWFFGVEDGGLEGGGLLLLESVGLLHLLISQ